MTKWPIGVALLTIVAFAAVRANRPEYWRTCTGDKSSDTKCTIRTIRGAVDLFEQDIGRYPAQHEGLGVLQQAPPGEVGWKGIYYKGDLIDPWGTPFAYRWRANGPLIISAGPDKSLDTADDIQD